MGNQDNRFRAVRDGHRFRMSPATVLAVIALFISLGGTSIAASGLINGKKIKPGTVTGKQIRNKTITKGKIAPATVRSLRGNQGPKGERGPSGVATAYQDETTTGVSLDDPHIAELEVPAGRYLVSAKVELYTEGATDVGCWVAFDYGDYLDYSRWSSPGKLAGSARWGTISLLGISPPGTEVLTLRCFADDSAGTTGRSKVVAVPVAD